MKLLKYIFIKIYISYELPKKNKKKKKYQKNLSKKIPRLGRL